MPSPPEDSLTGYPIQPAESLIVGTVSICNKTETTIFVNLGKDEKGETCFVFHAMTVSEPAPNLAEEEAEEDEESDWDETWDEEEDEE